MDVTPLTGPGCLAQISLSSIPLELVFAAVILLFGFVGNIAKTFQKKKRRREALARERGTAVEPMGGVLEELTGIGNTRKTPGPDGDPRGLIPSARPAPGIRTGLPGEGTTGGPLSMPRRTPPPAGLSLQERIALARRQRAGNTPPAGGSGSAAASAPRTTRPVRASDRSGMPNTARPTSTRPTSARPTPSAAQGGGGHPPAPPPSRPRATAPRRATTPPSPTPLGREAATPAAGRARQTTPRRTRGEAETPVALPTDPMQSAEIGTLPQARTGPRSGRRGGGRAHPLLGRLDARSMRQAIALREVLDAPVALRTTPGPGPVA